MKKLFLILLAVVLLPTTLPAAAASHAPSNLDPPIVSFQAPPTYHPDGRVSAGVSKAAFTDAGDPVPFIPLVACRQYDSRNATPLANNTPRAVELSGAPCGIPFQATAVAVNITVFSITGATGNGVFKAGSADPPTTAWINYPPTETQRGNAGVLPVAAPNDTLYVQVNQGGGSVHFTVDVFGYYSFFAANQQNGFSLYNNAGRTMTLTNGSTTCFGFCGLQVTVNSGSAIEGVSLGGTGLNWGVFGAINPTSAAGSAGVRGLGTNTSPSISYGVLGETEATASDSAGVRGLDALGAASDSFPHTSGVRGEGSIGVLGISSEFGGAGVAGLFNDSSGFHATSAYLGYDSQIAVYASGKITATGTKSFVEPHPTDPTLVINYVALEGPEAGTYFRGTSQTRNGTAVITVPESFRIVTDAEGMTVQLTPVGVPARLYVVTEDLNQIVVRSDRDVTFHYMVNGFRRAYKDHRDIAATGEYAPRSEQDRMPLSFSPEAKQRLIANGTYNPDGTVNMDTARRLGWVKAWEDRKAAAEAAAAARREAQAKPGAQNQTPQ